MDERYLSLVEACEVLGKSERTLYRWIKSGKLRADKPGRDYEIRVSAIEEMREKSVVRPNAPAPLPEPSLLDGLEDERRQYPYPWLADTIARALAEWTRIVEAKENAFYSRTIAVICFDLIDAVTLGYRGEWDNLPAEEKPERRQLAEALDNLAMRGFEHYKASKAAQEAEVREIERRREEMRRRTQEISA